MKKDRIPLKLTEEILLTIPEAASLIHTQQQTVRALVKAGHIKALRLGELKIRRTELDRFLESAEGLDYQNPAEPKELII